LSSRPCWPVVPRLALHSFAIRPYRQPCRRWRRKRRSPRRWTQTVLSWSSAQLEGRAREPPAAARPPSSQTTCAARRSAAASWCRTSTSSSARSPSSTVSGCAQRDAAGKLAGLSCHSSGGCAVVRRYQPFPHLPSSCFTA